MFYGHTFHISGRLGPTGMQGIDSAVFTRIEDTYVMAEESGEKAVRPLTIPRGSVSSVLVKVEYGASPDAVAGEISRQIPGTRIITQNSLLNTVTLHLTEITRFLYNSAIVVIVISVPLLGIISVIIARENRRKIALLGALGATREFIVRLIFTEFFSSSVIGSVAGIGATALILVSFQDFVAYTLKIPFAVPSPLTLLAVGGIALFLSFTMGAVASIYPTIRLVHA